MTAHDQAARPLKRPNLKETVADYIRELIFSGALKPGSKIDQDGLADRLQVSKLPVREALITLESEALVRNLPRRGSYVAHLRRTDVHDHYNIYGMVAGLAAERAASALTAPELDELERLIERMERSASPLEQEEVNHEFHRIINQAGGSERLKSVLRLLSNSIPTRFFLFTRGWAEVANQHHRELLAALKSGDGVAARQGMERHLRESAQYAISSLEERGFWNSEDPDAT